MKRIIAATSGAALLFCGLAGSTAEATPGTGTAVTDEVVGVLSGPASAGQDGVRLRNRTDVKVRTFTLTYAVGGYSGWHSHPGIVVATVVSGKVVQRVGCDEPRIWEPGQSFTEVGPHYVSNLYKPTSAGGVPAVLSITQIFPAEAAPLREDQSAPRCS